MTSTDVANAHLGWVRNTHAAMQPFVSRAAVTNYADPELEDSATAYYGSHLKRLVTVKQHYDPDNFFRYSQISRHNSDIARAGARMYRSLTLDL